MTPFSATLALELVDLIRAAYQLSWNQQIALPDGWSLRSLITVDINQADKTADKPAIIATENCNWGVSCMRGTTGVIAIRGTETRTQWLEDFEATRTPAPVDWPTRPGAVHRGFYEVYSQLRGSLIAADADLAGMGCQEIYVTGHSLGAALALLAGVSLARNTWTFAGPRVFGPGVDFPCYRIVNHWDIVPHVPLPPMYRHVGTQVGVDSGFSKDVRKTHSLEYGYVPGLRALAEKEPRAA